MGCSSSKAGLDAMGRMLEYQQMAEREELGLKQVTKEEEEHGLVCQVPKGLDLEEWRDGLISPRTMFNLFHAGYCSAFIQNPTYLLVR